MCLNSSKSITPFPSVSASRTMWTHSSSVAAMSIRVSAAQSSWLSIPPLRSASVDSKAIRILFSVSSSVSPLRPSMRSSLRLASRILRYHVAPTPFLAGALEPPWCPPPFACPVACAPCAASSVAGAGCGSATSRSGLALEEKRKGMQHARPPPPRGADLPARLTTTALASSPVGVWGASVSVSLRDSVSELPIESSRKLADPDPLPMDMSQPLSPRA
mmetsp:Transcript_3975/g.7815  ORF Transcript_3975/g.7815 Transcript_3975/m.7815 type:complete len:218 (-) Transcript_3975:13-666(-)|eukprot:CAMPEP_0173392108 /NCGR_PEP_ID=MMETSP1356-20130122/18763_1 /TAXON_ID=77927 ORGANISM="Hemiselmis virescens, Strain PCC157" /NCGR_SAMPLE_ID=MMETSP1356 /ASSEMBLY_ACC=CAM_ASM_000847 /LENGTH=217 /DNA_ID=CAMNT_0014349827 /DNA_START=647 /DNA_END=1300 /DNA_ORIENTATION=-